MIISLDAKSLRRHSSGKFAIIERQYIRCRTRCASLSDQALFVATTLSLVATVIELRPRGWCDKDLVEVSYCTSLIEILSGSDSILNRCISKVKPLSGFADLIEKRCKEIN